MIMLKTWIGIFLTVGLLAGCAELSTYKAGAMPTIEGTPGKAVIYVVRSRPDLSYLAAPITLDDRMLGATYAGTYMRLEVEPGRHRLAGAFQDNGAMTLDVQADRIYFVQHKVAGSWRVTNPHSFFQAI